MEAGGALIMRRRLQIRNVPHDLYAALRKRAKENGTSIAADVLALLKEDVPTARELARRRRLYEQALKISSRPGGLT